MVTNSNSPTRDINRRLLLTLHQDGLLDILAGLIVSTFGFVPILDETGMNPGVRQILILSFYGASVIGVLWLKRRITLPRSGYVKLTSRFSSRLSLIILIANVLIFILFAGAYIFDLQLWEYFGAHRMSVPLGLIFLVMLTVSGGLLRAPRFYLYGILVFCTYLLFEHLFLRGMAGNHGLPLAAFLSGGVMILSGVIILCRYMNRYSAE